MFRFFTLSAFSLIEITITIFILVISIYFISPVVFSLKDKFALQSEIENIQSFIYQVQSKARFNNQNYSLTISQKEFEKKWCIIAVKKEKNSTKQIICDCLNIQSCNLNDEHFIYKPQYKNIIVKNKSLYPKSFINIDGLAGRLESKCLNVSLNKESEILQFDQWGRVYVSPKNKRSTCKD